MQRASQDYLKNGIALTPSRPQAHDKVTVTYSGLLPQSGATHVYAHVGFGDNWRHIHDYEMVKTAGGFEATVAVVQGDTMHIAFKDCAGHWDNNSGNNYSFEVWH
ncbi:carbohydrate-binding protein [Sporomusa sp.]|uniref:carbohydrate-binding protein n=1 Tax=Sporomusa sp. TaxID=2078658 RepID=UPI002C14E511|nr:carbohydrate-binding protein [Sporomusa sp.]HWR44737.1 carbohydrate-binding protein [Sporomusa sp.]